MHHGAWSVLPVGFILLLWRNDSQRKARDEGGGGETQRSSSKLKPILFLSVSCPLGDRNWQSCIYPRTKHTHTLGWRCIELNNHHKENKFNDADSRRDSRSNTCSVINQRRQLVNAFPSPSSFCNAAFSTPGNPTVRLEAMNRKKKNTEWEMITQKKALLLDKMKWI